MFGFHEILRSHHSFILEMKSPPKNLSAPQTLPAPWGFIPTPFVCLRIGGDPPPIENSPANTTSLPSVTSTAHVWRGPSMPLNFGKWTGTYSQVVSELSAMQRSAPPTMHPFLHKPSRIIYPNLLRENREKNTNPMPCQSQYKPASQPYDALAEGRFRCPDSLSK
jgi:hypothetical protein